MAEKYGKPPDLSNELDKLEISSENVIQHWQTRRLSRNISDDEIHAITAAHDRMDNVLSQTHKRLTEANKNISKFDVDVASDDFQSTLHVENEKAFGSSRVTKRKSDKNILSKSSKPVVMVTAGVQTQIQSLDLDVIRTTVDELNKCQEAQETMMQYFTKLREKWQDVSNQTIKLAMDYNNVVAQSCGTCAFFQQELHTISGQVAALKSQMELGQNEKEGVRQQLSESVKHQSRLRLEAEGAISREEATLNKVAFMEEENTYMRKELEEARENARVLRIELRKLEEDREHLMANFVESRLKQGEVVSNYLDQLQEREEERREFLRAMDSDSRMEKLLSDTDRQATLSDERNQLTEEVDLLTAKCTAQDLHIEDLLRQLADLAKVVDAYESYNVRSSMTEVVRMPSGLHGVGSYTRALNSHRSGTGTGAGTVTGVVQAPTPIRRPPDPDRGNKGPTSIMKKKDTKK